MIGNPLAGAGLAIILALSAALWWQSSSLSDARDRIAVHEAVMEICEAANASAGRTITELRAAQEANAALRDAAIQRQAEAVARIRELEARNREPEIIRIREAAGADACAVAPLPDALRVRVSPHSDSIRDRDG